jgi:acetyltransferase-like isoleucine patch superfamily enzyme
LYRPFFKKIGKGVLIWDNVIFKFPGDISLGDNVQIAQQCLFIGKSGLEIGNDVMIGMGTKIITSTHNHDSLEIPMYKQGLSFSPITIENDVWFGFNCVVLGGTKIGKGSIIAANAVVIPNEYERFSIIAGVPGKVVKKRI